MKKEFKAPTLEAKELNALNSIMDGSMLISTGKSKEGLIGIEDTTKSGYVQWKGYKAQ